MKFLGMGVPELLIILVVILVIFGPKNLPKLGNALGKTVKNIRQGREDDKEETKEGVGEKTVAQIEATDEDADVEEVVTTTKTTKTTVSK